MPGAGERRPPLVLFLSDFERLCPQQGNAHTAKEGETYEMVNGEPTFTEYVTNNPDGKTLAQMVGLTCAVRDSAFPMLQTWQYYKQTLQPWGIEAIETWMADNADTGNILPQISRTQEESERYSELMNPIKTYMQEQANKLITGSIRPEEFIICKDGTEGIHGTVQECTYLGLNTHYTIDTDQGDSVEIVEESSIGEGLKKGEKVLLKVKKEKINVFTKDGDTNLIRSDAYEKQ